MAKGNYHGFELGYTSNNTSIDNNGFAGNSFPVSSTSNPLSQAYSGLVSNLSSGVNKMGGIRFATANSNGPFFIRGRLKITIAPSAENRFFVLINSIDSQKIWLT